MNVDTLLGWIKESFGSFDSSVTQAIKIVTEAPGGDMLDFTNKAYDIILPIAITLAVLYFFMDFLNRSIMLDYVKWENVIKSILKLLVCRVIMVNVKTLTSGIFSIVSGVTSKIGDGATSQMNNIDYDAIKNSMGNPGLLDTLAILPKFVIIWVMMWLVVKVILLVVYGRMIQIYIYTMFAPIPLATLAGEGFNGTAKNFIKNYTSVCFQGTIIIASLGLYGAVMKTVLGKDAINSFDGLGQILLMSFVLLFLLIKSGDWSKKIIGGN